MIYAGSKLLAVTALVSAAVCFADGVIHLSSEQAFEQLLHDRQVVVAKFEAPWCGPCKEAKKPFEEIAKEIGSSEVAFVAVDIEKHAGVAQKYNVMSIPTVVFFAQGKEVGRDAGMVGAGAFKDSIRSKVERYKGQSGQEAQAPAQTAAEETMPPAEQPESEGFVSKIVGGVAGLIGGILGFIKGIIDWLIGLVRGLF